GCSGLCGEARGGLGARGGNTETPGEGGSGGFLPPPQPRRERRAYYRFAERPVNGPHRPPARCTPLRLRGRPGLQPRSRGLPRSSVGPPFTVGNRALSRLSGAPFTGLAAQRCRPAVHGGEPGTIPVVRAPLHGACPPTV